MEYICDKIILIKKFENCMYISKLELWVECLSELYDIDLHQSNFKPFKILKFLDEILFEKCVLLHLFANTCIIISSFLKKTHYHTKEDEIYRWALKKKFSFFCLVVFNRSQT